jgi:hypothetical protein
MSNNTNSNQPLRIIALTLLLVGSIGSLYFMFNVGRNQKSIILLLLFTGWVLSPFVGLLIANSSSNRWFAMRKLIYWLMIVLPIASLAAYSGILLPPDVKPAFIFLVFPLASWLVLLAAYLITRNISNKNYHS